MKSMLKSLMSVAVAALAFTSCSNDATEDVMPNGGTKTLVVNATIDQTRTVMAENHIDLNWTESDEIYLYIGDKLAKADVKKINPLTGGTIKNVTYKNGDMVYANYSLDNERSNGAAKAEIKIDAVQTQSAANVFAGENLPMTAKGAIENGSVSLNFQPFGCVLVFNVYGSAYNANEKIKSIKFETSVGCYGYDNCDLTAESLGYTAYNDAKDKSVTVTLTTPATIGAAKPSDTKVGENQVYLVLAPVNYTDATITVNTTLDSEKIFNTYTFKTSNGIDCSQYTARVVNLNLAKAAVVPSIEVPTVPQQLSDGGELTIENIVFKNLAVSEASVGVYSNAELTESTDVAWLTINNATNLANGTLSCNVAANTGAERTAYIGIKCGNVQAAIAVTQVGAGSTPAVNAVATYIPKNMGYTDTQAISKVTLDNDAVTLNFSNAKYYDSSDALRCYKDSKITVTSTSKIKEIKFVRNSEKSGNLSPNVGTWTEEPAGTFFWTGESNIVELTVINAQFRIVSMEITYVESKEPKIIAPTTVADKQPAEGSTLTIKDIVFKNIDVAKVTTGVYSNAELTESTDVAWLTIANADLANGTLSCNVAANDGAERTAYIGIKYDETVKAAIAVTQKAKGAVEKYFVKVTENLEDWTGDYLIVYEGGNKAFNGALEGAAIDKSKNYIDNVNITEQGILSDETTNASLVKISKKAGATGEYMYLLQAASGYYLYSSSDDTNMKYNTSKEEADKHPHSISISSGSAKIQSSATGNRCWRFNSTYFRYYSSSSYSPVQLYKLQK